MRAVAVLVLALVITGCARKKAAVAVPPPAVISKPEPRPSPVKRARRVQARPVQATIEHATTPPLESIKTPAEQREILELIKTSVARAEANLAALRARELNADEARELGRVDSFLRQARSAEEANDLVAARHFARRAEVLSADLLNR